MSTVKIEKIGGLAGFGLPGSRLKSSGETAVSALSPADQAWVEASFQRMGATKLLKFLRHRCHTR